MTQQPYEQLTEHFAKLDRIHHALTFLQWDQLVMMPPQGNDNRAEAVAELSAIHHQELTSPLTAELLEQAEATELSPEQQTSLQEMRQSYQRAACLPTSLVKRQSLAGSRCEHAWRTQRNANDWPAFLANFREVVTLAREEAQARQAVTSLQTPYDAMFDLYCEGDSAENIEQIFTTLRQELPPLIDAICERQGDTFLPQGSFPVEQQETLSRRLMHYLGFNFDAGRLDVSLHPFSTGDRGDQRITTRFRETEFLEALLATAHETGHASYENGLPAKWAHLPIGTARNMCIHESQSLLFEKHLFLSRPFFTFFCNEIHRYLPAASDFDNSALWSACTRVEPSLIRIEADEATYPLHVILRFEIEKDLINGKIEADDIPELWNSKMRHYLGLDTEGNFKDGCLQDIHWTDGTFGYFPSYTMGAVNAAQFFEAFTKENVHWEKELGQGDTTTLRQWLQEKVWSQASSLSSQQIVARATGTKTSADSLLRHLTARYLP